jgi:hypothetical protein
MAISEVDVEGVGLTEFLEDLGVHMKSLKDKPAATLHCRTHGPRIRPVYGRHPVYGARILRLPLRGP